MGEFIEPVTLKWPQVAIKTVSPKACFQRRTQAALFVGLAKLGEPLEAAASGGSDAVTTVRLSESRHTAEGAILVQP